MTRRLVAMAGTVVLMSTTATAAWASDADSPAYLIDEMTGRDAVTDTDAKWAIEGTDLGIMWDDGEGGVLAAFGDTFGDWVGDGGGGGDWRSNVLLRSTDTDLSQGMSFEWALEDSPGHAGEIIGSKKIPGVEHTTIPTAGIQVDGRHYISYMSVREWGGPGEWWTNFAKLIHSDDGGQTWVDTDTPEWENDEEGTSPFQMHAFVHHEGHLYVFATPNGRFGAAHLGRVAEGDILDPEAYEYWTGSQWSADLDEIEPIVPPNVAELSVHYDEEKDLWLMVYLNEDTDIVLRTADAPTGPWSDTQVLASFEDYPGLYGGYIHPWSPSGELYFAMTIWSGYNVALMKVEYDEDGRIVRPNLVKNPSFERGTDFENSAWQVKGNAGIDTEIDWAKLGAHQFWLRNNTGTGEIHQTIDVQPHTLYELACWAKTGGAGDEGALGARPSPQVSGDVPLSEETFENLEGWHRLVTEVDTGDNDAIEVYIRTGFTNGDRWVQGDDCSLVEIGPGQSVEPEPDPGEDPDPNTPDPGETDPSEPDPEEADPGEDPEDSGDEEEPSDEGTDTLPDPETSDEDELPATGASVPYGLAAIGAVLVAAGILMRKLQVKSS